MSRVVIRNGRVVDPGNGIDRLDDLYLGDGRVVALGRAPGQFRADVEIDATGCIVCPGLVDLRARLGEPGYEHKATIASETRAAVRSGITTLCCPPDTHPVVDTPAVVELIHQRASQCGLARVEVLGALTQGLEGTQLAEMGALGAAGCRGVANALSPVVDTEVMRRAMEYAATFGLTVFVHAEDPWLAKGRIVHDGEISTRLGLAGIPEIAETIMVARELLLVEETGARTHFCHLSTGPAVDMIRDAKEHGLPVTADVSAHHLHLTEEGVGDFDADYHVRPPLRTVEDRDRLRTGVADGVIDVVCSDHQPHEVDAKLNPFPLTEPGISALETLLPLTLRLVDDDLMTMSAAIATLTSRPAAVLGVPAGTLSVDAPADVCVFDPLARWTLEAGAMASAGRNTPLLDHELKGLVTHTLVDNRLVHEARDRRR